MNKKATKLDTNKPRLDLLPSNAIFEIGKVLSFGANKYNPDNWRKGLEWRRLIGATFRHLFSFLKGENIDPESKLSHLAHASVNLLFLLEYFLTNTGIDDRYTYKE